MKFINRELSWIEFNKRVLDCADNPDTPLNERMNFLSITTSNLDEFIAVRFGYVWHHKNEEPYKKILKEIQKFIVEQQKVYQKLCKELTKHKIKIHNEICGNKDTKNIFNSKVFPLLTPVSVGSYNDIPTLANGQMCIACEVDTQMVLIPIDRNIDKLFKVGNDVYLTENIILEYLDQLFVSKKIKSSLVFRVIKDYSIELKHDENKFIIERMNDVLTRRKKSKNIFIEIIKNKTSGEIINRIIDLLKIPVNNAYYTNITTDFKRFNQHLLNENFSYPPFDQRYFNTDNNFSLLSVLDTKDILLHHPYDSFETVVKFIEHAAIDPKVVAIKQTLYRVSGMDSPIVNALCRAAKNGKQVSVLVEIKARFDEENNIHLIDKLESAGCTVLYGLEYLKTHCKMCVVIRKEYGELKFYSNIGTGNYNEKTANIYTDLSYFTSKYKIGIDLLNVFNIISGVSRPEDKLNKVYYSPLTLRKTLVKNIDREISNVKNGKEGEIIIKVNSISDKDIVAKLYEAASYGVKITIICRGVCSIVPTKNIFIKSIVGRFLEHSRIYYFKNNKSPEYLISSADLLTRNLDRRVEIMVSLKGTNVISSVKKILNKLIKDEANSFIMNKDGKYEKNKGDYNAHEHL